MENVPLRMYGVQVAELWFDDKGTLNVTATVPSELGLDLKQRFEASEYEYMALMPGGVPMPPPPPPADEPSPEE